MIELCDVTRKYGSRVALAGVSLTVDAGRLLAIVGPNGAGKTTLFKLLMGLMGPTSGTIRINGETVWPPGRYGLGITAALLDNHVPPSGVRLQDLIDLKAGTTPKFDRTWCRDLFAELPGVSPKRRFGELSKGQRQWALSSVALAACAELLILDEPGDGLDTAARRRLLSLLRQAVDECGVTVLIASHVLTDLERVADSIVVLQSGRVRLQAELEDLREEVREVEFGGELPDFAADSGTCVLAKKSLSDGTLAWLRQRDWDSGPHVYPGERSRRPVGLEELYLALVGADAPPSNILQEIAP